MLFCSSNHPHGVEHYYKNTSITYISGIFNIWPLDQQHHQHLVRNADSWAPHQPAHSETLRRSGAQQSGLTSPPCDSDACSSLRILSVSLENRSPYSGEALVLVFKALAVEIRFMALFLMVLPIICHTICTLAVE